MARKKLKENNCNPPYVVRRSGRFYLEPKGGLLEKLGGKKSFPLGGTYMEMFSNYKAIMEPINGVKDSNIRSMRQLIDRYMLEISPEKADSGRKAEVYRCNLLKHVFGDMDPRQITKVDIYKYIDWRTGDGAPVAVNREVALLSAIFKKGERWGAVELNPVSGIKRNEEFARTRYVTDAEYKAFRGFVEKRNPVVAAYMDFKYLTGLRGKDIRDLKKSTMNEDGWVVTIGKTGRKRKPPKKILIEWTPAFRQVTKKLIEVCGREKIDKKGKIERARVESEYLLHTRTGGKYTLDGWCSIFFRLMKKAVEEGVLTESFTDHDIRAKAGSDKETLEEASKFLAHLNVKITADHYRRKIERIQPLM